jgi:hypothetical protein
MSRNSDIMCSKRIHYNNYRNHSRITALLCVHFLQRTFDYWNQFRKSSFGLAVKTAVTFRLICYTEAELWPLSPTFWLRSARSRMDWDLEHTEASGWLELNSSPKMPQRHGAAFNRLYIEIGALLGYYAASCGNCLPTIRDNVSLPSSRVKSPNRKKNSVPVMMGPILCTE